MTIRRGRRRLPEVEAGIVFAHYRWPDNAWGLEILTGRWSCWIEVAP